MVLVRPGLSVGAGNPGLDARVSAELDLHNFSAVGVDDLRKPTVAGTDAEGPVVGAWTAADVHFRKTLDS